MRVYRSCWMRDLARQLSIRPPDDRKRRVTAAEELIDRIEPDMHYSCQDVARQLTLDRMPPGQPAALDAETLQSDLQTLILDLSDTLDWRGDSCGERVYDTKSVAEHFDVCTKTIQRWRKRGLASRRMVFEDGKRRTVFLQRSIDTFEARRLAQIERSRRFTRLTATERDDIIHRAKRMAHNSEFRMGEVAKRIAVRTGRAEETVRYTIRRHDAARPNDAIFPTSNPGPAKRLVRASAGTPRGSADGKRPSVREVVLRPAARRLMELDIDYVYSEQFDLPDAEQTILTPPPAQPKPGSQKIRPPKDLPPYLASLYNVPLLAVEMEQHLFRKYNYLKHKADRLRASKLAMGRVGKRALAEVDHLLAQAGETKNHIIRANLRLVVSVARKRVSSDSPGLFELVSDGNMTLMRAIEKFDYTRGYKFSTYAYLAIARGFSRSMARERSRSQRFATGQGEVLNIAAGADGRDVRQTQLGEIRETLDLAMAQLPFRERSVLSGHYGLGEMGASRTLEELGRKLGISKERVRQVEISAIKRLREMLDPVHTMLMSG